MCVSVYEVICIELYIYTHSQILIVISLSRTMQDLRFYPTCSKINLLLFNICWQKTQNSWVRDKGFHCSQPEQESESLFVSVAPSPPSLRFLHVQWIVDSRRTLTLGIYCFHGKWEQACSRRERLCLMEASHCNRNLEKYLR